MTATHGATHYALNLKENDAPKININRQPSVPPTKTAFHTGLSIY